MKYLISNVLDKMPKVVDINYNVSALTYKNIYVKIDYLERDYIMTAIQEGLHDDIPRSTTK